MGCTCTDVVACAAAHMLLMPPAGGFSFKLFGPLDLEL